MSFLVDTNILIYHTAGSAIAKEFLADLIAAKAFNISMITRIEFSDGTHRLRKVPKDVCGWSS